MAVAAKPYLLENDMTTLTVEQILAANKTALTEAQNIAATALAGFEKLVALNLSATKAALTETSAELLSTFTAQNPSDVLAAQAALIKPLAEKTVSYSRSVYAIASETTGELTKAAEAKTSEAQKVFANTLDTMAKNAPAGSESVVAAVKSALTAGQHAIETAKSTAKKAVEIAEKQAASVTETALNTVKSPARKK
jgi:phasin family protein